MKQKPVTEKYTPKTKREKIKNIKNKVAVLQRTLKTTRFENCFQRALKSRPSQHTLRKKEKSKCVNIVDIT